MAYRDEPSIGSPSLSEQLRSSSHGERVIFWVAAINFATFIVIAFFIGGDALNGRQLDGHYFLGSHGHYTEVARAVYEYSLIHVGSQFITFPLGIIAKFSARLRAEDASPSD